MRSTLKNIGALIFWVFIWNVGIAPSSNANSEINNPLVDTRWRLVEFQSMDDSIGMVRPGNSSDYTMHLAADGIVNMKLNCNLATGEWLAESGTDGLSGRFEFSALASTRAVCLPPSMDESITAQSTYIRSYYLKDGKLYLSLLADAGIYVWAREGGDPSLEVPIASPENGGPLNWEVTTISGTLNLREQPSLSSKVVANLRKGTILDNLDCQESDGRYWCYVQTIGGGPVGYAAAEFLKPAISPNGAAITGPDDSALRAGQGYFDATGKISCAFHPGQPMTECTFGVARKGGGYATVIIERPDSRKRAIFFRMGIPIGADTSEADGYLDFSTTKEGDRHLIRVGDERYEIFDAVVLGG